MITPEQLEQQLEIDRSKRSVLLSKIDLQKTISTSNTDQLPNLQGLDNLNHQINTVSENLKTKAVTELLTLSSELGIQNISTSPAVPDTCPQPTVLQRALLRRNNLVSEIQTAASFINIVGTILDTTSNILTGTETTLEALNTLKTVTTATVQATPVVPGAVTAALSLFDDVRTLLTFKTDGTPRLPEIKRALETGATYTTQAGVTLSNTIGLLNIIDQTLIKCGQTPDTLGNQIETLIRKGQSVTSNTFETSYRGFTFNIVERPFSPTVNRKVGQALNSEGIVLLETEPSFTQNPQVLIEELKLIIDRDNLKAN